jgi:N-acetylglucosaminyl-diphospho-decaprenol L-rhamnosyltransferase
MSDAPAVRTLVSVVTFRAAALTIQCLEALASEVQRTPGTRVIVVDNDSGDGTAEAIEQAIVAEGWGNWVDLIRSPRNGGFSFGNNVAYRFGLQRYPGFDRFLLLNPDTMIRPGAIVALRDFLEQHPDAAVAGGRCEHPDGVPQDCAFRFPGMISEFAAQIRLGAFDQLFRDRLVITGHHDVPTQVDWVTGAMMMIRREVLESVGLLDEGYFLYFEETDLMFRMRRAGWNIWHVPAARAVHLVGQITGVQSNPDRPRRLPAYWYESRRRYFVLTNGLAYAVAVDLVVLVGQALWQIRRLVERKKEANPLHWVGDLVRMGVLGRGSAKLPPRIIR